MNLDLLIEIMNLIGDVSLPVSVVVFCEMC